MTFLSNLKHMINYSFTLQKFIIFNIRYYNLFNFNFNYKKITIFAISTVLTKYYLPLIKSQYFTNSYSINISLSNQ